MLSTKQRDMQSMNKGFTLIEVLVSLVILSLIGLICSQILSSALESEEISMPEIPIEQLRNDEYIPFDEKLIEKMNHYKGTYVRAPKM